LSRYELKHYRDDQTGNEIIAHENIEDSSDVKFDGQAVIGIHTPMGVIERPILFPIQAKFIEDAFRNFEEAKKTEAPKKAKETVEQMKREMMEAHAQQQSKIIVPNEAVKTKLNL